jgi:hypothetical protein
VGTPASTEAATGRVVSVRGVVVHQAPLLDRYAVIGPEVHLLPILTDGALPPFGRRVRVSIRQREVTSARGAQRRPGATPRRPS